MGFKSFNKSTPTTTIITTLITKYIYGIKPGKEL